MKKLSNDESILNSIGLNLENGKLRKGADRIIYQTALEAIYCKLGNSIGQPSKLDKFFKNKDFNSEQEILFNKIEIFLKNLSSTDRDLFNQKSVTTDLKLIFCLILFGKFEYDIKDYKEYILNIVNISGLVKSLNDTKSNEKRVELYDKLDKYNLLEIYENNKDIFNTFSTLRSGAKGMPLVSNICRKISLLYKQNEVVTYQ
jgi:hypothetical protein